MAANEVMAMSDDDGIYLYGEAVSSVLPVFVPCPDCGGWGKRKTGEDCPTCGGTGWQKIGRFVSGEEDLDG